MHLPEIEMQPGFFPAHGVDFLNLRPGAFGSEAVFLLEDFEHLHIAVSILRPMDLPGLDVQTHLILETQFFNGMLQVGFADVTEWTLQICP